MPLSALLLLLLASVANCYPNFQSLIPNGERVHHPCFEKDFWQGVGHFSMAGGGRPNKFGADFLKAGKTWTRELCMKDSDGDGRTNGDELGDPGCAWSKGGTPTRVSNISHPGVCQPLSSAHCKKLNGAWDICASNKLVCPAIKEPNVTNITLRFTKTNIPSKVTNYVCQAFELPKDKDYHMIAQEPLIDNSEVMHHALVFGCGKKPDDGLFKAPRECGMGGITCQQLISGWSIGAPGDCVPSQFGIKFGLNGFKYVVIQYHWNNIAQRKDLWDASAFRFFLTTNLRPADGAIMMAGQRYLKLPPGKDKISQEATCTSDCTSMLKHDVNLTDISPHMHNAGTFAEAAHYRNGKKLRDLLKYTPVTYDKPQKYSFKEPILFKRGDEIKMKCYYKTTNLKETMYYGDSTQDEMCFFFMNYYPATSFPPCLNYGPIDMCGIYLPKNGGKYGIPGNVGKCNIADFFITKLPKKWKPMLDEFCDYSITACRSGCMTVLKRMLAEEPCWQGWAKKYLDLIALSDDEMRKVRLRLSQCEMQLLAPQPPTKPEKPTKGGLSDQMMQTILISVGTAAVLVLLVVVAVIGVLKAINGSKKDPPIVDLGKNQPGVENNAYVYDPENTKM